MLPPPPKGFWVICYNRPSSFPANQSRCHGLVVMTRAFEARKLGSIPSGTRLLFWAQTWNEMIIEKKHTV
jgi:hypothetical protein